MKLTGWPSNPALPVALALLAPLLLLPPPNMAGDGLDPSWMLSLEHASRAGLLFGRDFIFSYGPFGVLATHLYHPDTYALVILGDLLVSALFVLPLLWSRRPYVLALYAIAILAAAINKLGYDARILAALLALFLFAIRTGGWWPVAAAAAISPFFLSKYSFAVAGFPLLILADAYRVAAFRRLPLLTPAALAVMLAGMIATGHPLGTLPEILANIGELVGAYGSSMQYEMWGSYPLLAALAAAAAIAVAMVWLAWRRRSFVAGGRGPLGTAAALAGIGWILFMAVKMGHVRQDLHIFVTWQAMVMIVPVVLAWLDALSLLERRERLVAALLFVGALAPVGAIDAGLYVHHHGLRPVAYASDRAAALVGRPVNALAWLAPGRWQEMNRRRDQARARVAAQLPAGVTGPVDIIPFNTAPLIAAGADYRPRPLPQTYSAYTARLQRLDAAHFANSATAPATLFFAVGDIDERLPTLAMGPSLAIIARWYDIAGASPLGLVLRRRAEPRPARAAVTPQRGFALGEWVPVPRAPDRMVMARIRVDSTAAGKLAGFLLREPILSISLRYDDGRERSFRFVPRAAQTGFLISPMTVDADPRNLRAAAAMLQPGLGRGAARPVVAFRIGGGALAGPAFSDGQVSYQLIELAAGSIAATTPAAR